MTANQKLRLALIGPKRVGKDHFRETVFPDYRRAALADVLKELSVAPKYAGILNHDPDYLMKDFSDVNANPELLALISERASKDGLANGFVSDVASMDTPDGRRALMDVFKNFPDELRTRKYLQNFGDVIKTSESRDFFSKLFLETTASHDAVVCTDARFLIEIVDFVIAGYPFVTLNHTNSEKAFDGTEHMQHLSEFELSLSVSKYGHVGRLVDLTGKDSSDFPRLTKDETMELGKDVRFLVENFEGYPMEVTAQFQDFKEQLMHRRGEFGKYGLYEDGYTLEWAKKVAGEDYSEGTMRLCFEKLMEARAIVAETINRHH